MATDNSNAIANGVEPHSTGDNEASMEKVADLAAQVGAGRLAIITGGNQR